MCRKLIFLTFTILVLWFLWGKQETLFGGKNYVEEEICKILVMFIVNPLKGGGMMKLFSTHPPMEERIKRLQEIADGRR